MKKIYTSLPINVPDKEINSLTEFITEITGVNSNSYYFRGEDKYNITQNANAYRKYKKGNEPLGFTNNYVKFPELLEDYYLQIGSSIGNAEKENFIAYAQHHGLKTPLLDVTTNGLVALYFATSPSQIEVEKDQGIVYVYDALGSIDISDFLRGRHYSDVYRKLIYLDDKEFVRTIILGLLEIINNNEKLFLMYEYSLVQHIQLFRNEKYSGLRDEDYIRSTEEVASISLPSGYDEVKIEWEDIAKEQDYNNMLYKVIYHETVKKQFESHHSKLKEMDNYSEYKNEYEFHRIVVYLFVLQLHFRELYSDTTFAYDFHSLPTLPQLIYRPTYLFDRMKAQNGLFFYQVALHKTESTYNSGSIEYQHYLPTKRLIINNKIEIRKDLDTIGISMKTLFPDADNIANYLNRQFQK